MKRTNEDKNILVGIYTLSHKAIEITNSNISNTTRKKLLRYAALDKDTNKYNISAFLIAQFGKNNAVPKKYSITGNELMDLTFELLKHTNKYNISAFLIAQFGNELMDLTFELLKHVQYCVGGGVVYLDCENVVKVLDFYQNGCNRFKIFGERESDVEQKKVFAITSIFLKNVILGFDNM